MLFLIVLALGAEARAEEPDLVTLALGAFDVRDDGTTAEARLEFRSGFEILIFRPLGGLMVNADGGGFLYGGILLDIPFGRHIVATLSVAPGAYLEGNSKDLGNVFEIRSEIELAYRFENNSRLGVSFSHISNLDTGDKNPGAESLMLSYSVPFERLLGRE